MSARCFFEAAELACFWLFLGSCPNRLIVCNRGHIQGSYNYIMNIIQRCPTGARTIHGDVGSLTGRCPACTQGPQKTQISHKRSRFTVRKRTMMESLMGFSETTSNLESRHSVQMFTESETSLRKRGKRCSLATHAHGYVLDYFLTHTHLLYETSCDLLFCQLNGFQARSSS